MRFIASPAICVLVLLCSGVSRAVDKNKDAASQEALTQTQQLLRNREQRKKEIQKSPDAQKADAQAQQLGMSSENVDAMYDISADLLGVLAERNGNDANKMAAEMAKWQKDPEGFLKSLPPAQRQKLEALTHKMEGAQKPKAKP